MKKNVKIRLALMAMLVLALVMAGAAAADSAVPQDKAAGWSVSFSCGQYTYSVGGGESAVLSDILSAVKPDTRIEEVRSAAFSDASLIRIEKEGADWRLDTLLPFDTVETLTVTKADGETFDISVTDPPRPGYFSDLRELVRSVSIEGAEVSGTTWTVQADTPYEMTVVFQESPRPLKQFDMTSPSFTYHLPAGIILEPQNGSGEISFAFGFQTYTLPYTYTIAQDGSVTITPDYSSLTPGDRRAFEAATNLNIKLQFRGNSP